MNQQEAWWAMMQNSGLQNFAVQQEAQVSKYCTRCGRELVKYTESWGYDRYTGAEDVHVFLKCPKFNFFWGDRHLHGIEVPRGEK